VISLGADDGKVNLRVYDGDEDADCGVPRVGSGKGGGGGVGGGFDVTIDAFIFNAMVFEPAP
jgi:hypothetical protein